MLNIILGAIALGLLWAVMTMGVYITYRLLDIADLSVEGNPWIGTFMALLSGLLCGLVTGLLHTKLKIPALLSGILTMIALYSVNLRIMGKANITLLQVETVFSPIERLPFMQSLAAQGVITKNVAILLCGLLVVALVSLFLYWFFGTELGSAIRATGNNQQMVRAQGVNTDTMILLGLMLSNGLVAMSGALIARRADGHRFYRYRPGFRYHWRGSVWHQIILAHPAFNEPGRDHLPHYYCAGAQGWHERQRFEAVHRHHRGYLPGLAPI